MLLDEDAMEVLKRSGDDVVRCKGTLFNLSAITNAPTQQVSNPISLFFNSVIPICFSKPSYFSSNPAKIA
jgi:hypothetical protein